MAHLHSGYTAPAAQAAGRAMGMGGMRQSISESQARASPVGTRVPTVGVPPAGAPA